MKSAKSLEISANSLGIISKEDEKLIFMEVENLLRSYDIPNNLCLAVIEPIRVLMSLEQKTGYEDFLGYFNAIEILPNKIELDKIFTYVPVRDKYQIIDAIFLRVQLKNGKSEFTLRPVYELIAQCREK